VSTIAAPSIEGDVVDNAGDIINRCYRQIYFHAMSSDRDRYLESQLRNGSITVRDFIRGLLLSDRFLSGYVACNSNYRLVEQVIGRVLGRKVRDNTEKLTYSIVIAEKGFEAFVDLVLNGEEYMQRFGYDTVPLERSRVLPGKAVGEAPVYQEFPRYSYDWQEKLTSMGMMMSIEDHLRFGPNKTFAERVIYERPSEKAFQYIVPSFIILSGIIVAGILKVLNSVFVVG
jgi:phycobilisome rod-core linker protein